MIGVFFVFDLKPPSKPRKSRRTIVLSDGSLRSVTNRVGADTKPKDWFRKKKRKRKLAYKSKRYNRKRREQ